MSKGKLKTPAFIIIGTLAVLALVFLGILLTAFLFQRSFAANYAGSICAVQGTQIVTVGFLLLIFLELTMLSFFVDTKPREPVQRPQFLGSRQTSFSAPHVNKWVVLAVRLVCIIAIAVIIIVCSNTYTVFSDTGVSNDCFKPTSQYKWENAKSYSITYSADEGLGFTVKMKDGKEFSLVSFDICTDEFSEKYVNVMQYMLAVDGKLEELQIQKNVIGLNQMESDLSGGDAETWECIKQLIDYDERMQ